MRRRLLWWVVAMALVVACSPPASSSARGESALASRIADASGDQAEILADGKVSNGELEMAFRNAMRCAEEDGAIVEAAWHGAGDFNLKFMGTSESGLGSSEDIVDRCLAEEFELVVEVYVDRYGASELERQHAERLYVDCANDAGLAGNSREAIHRAAANATIGGQVLSDCGDVEAQYLRGAVMQRADADTDPEPE